MALALLQIGLFTLVALATGALGDRLRRTGRAWPMESQLRQLRLDTDDILGAIDTGLVTVDEAGRLVYMNGAAETVLGIHQANWRLHGVLDELDRRAPGLGTVIRRTAATGIPVSRYEIRIRTYEGERYLGVRTTVLDRSGSPSVTAYSRIRRTASTSKSCRFAPRGCRPSPSWAYCRRTKSRIPSPRSQRGRTAGRPAPE